RRRTAVHRRLDPVRCRGGGHVARRIRHRTTVTRAWRASAGARHTLCPHGAFMDDNLKLNVIGPLLMPVLAAGLLLGSPQIHLHSDGPLFSSPALIAGRLGGVLIVMSLLLLGQTIVKAGLQNSMVNARRWLGELVRLPYART